MRAAGGHGLAPLAPAAAAAKKKKSCGFYRVSGLVPAVSWGVAGLVRSEKSPGGSRSQVERRFG